MDIVDLFTIIKIFTKIISLVQWIDPFELSPWDDRPEGGLFSKKSKSNERFFGDAMVQEYLNNNDYNPKRAWDAARMHRSSYKGLIEADRNAEHYFSECAVKLRRSRWRYQARTAKQSNQC